MGVEWGGNGGKYGGGISEFQKLTHFLQIKGLALFWRLHEKVFYYGRDTFYRNSPLPNDNFVQPTDVRKTGG